MEIGPDNKAIEETVFFEKTLERSRQKLLDLTRRNRLLNFREGVKDIAIIDEMADLVFEDLTNKEIQFSFSALEPEQQDDSIEQEIDKREQAINRTLPKSDGKEDLAEKYQDTLLQTPFSQVVLKRKLRSLYSASKTYIEETGANALYAIIGFLEWSDNTISNDVKRAKAPLVLLPLSMQKKGTYGEGSFTIGFDEQQLATNYSLSEKLLNDFDIKLPKYSQDILPEDYWTQVEAIIPSHLKEKGWRVVKEMVVGLFSFNKQIMWHDLNPENWPEHAPLVHRKVINRLLLGAENPNQHHSTNNQQQESEQVNHLLKLIRDADLSQQSAIIKALESNDGLVIEGPPGTGKSQTITNLIAVALSQNLSVLFVAEKMAALEVVSNNLKRSNLDLFCLQLHGLKSNKKQMLESLKTRIDMQVNFSQDIDAKESQLENSRNKLLEFSKIIKQKAGPEQLALYEIYWRVEKIRQQLPKQATHLEMEIDFEISPSDFIEIKQKLNDLGTHWTTIPNKARLAWQGFLPNQYQEHQQEKLLELNQNVIESQSVLQQRLAKHHNPEQATKLFSINRIRQLNKQLNRHLNSAGFAEFSQNQDENLIATVLQNKHLGAYRQLVADIQEYLRYVKNTNKIFDYTTQEHQNHAKTLLHHCKRLSNHAINDTTEIKDLAKQAQVFETTISQLKQLPEKSAYGFLMLSINVNTIKGYQSLIKDMSKIKKIVVEIVPFLSPTHIAPNFEQIYLEVKAKYAKIKQLEKPLNYFLLEKKITAKKLKKITKIIEANIGTFFTLFKKEYKQAKAKIKSLLITQSSFAKSYDFIEKLETYHKYLKTKEAFANNKAYKAQLGKEFKGIKTNWLLLDRAIKFAADLKQSLGYNPSTKILQDWNKHTIRAEVLITSVQSTLTEIDVFSQSHPFPESLWTKSIEQIAKTLTPWHKDLTDANTDLNQPWCQNQNDFKQVASVLVSYQKAKRFEKGIANNPCYEDIKLKYWQKTATPIDALKANLLWVDERLALNGMNENVLTWLFDETGQFDQAKYQTLKQQFSKITESFDAQIQYLTSLGEIDAIAWQGGEDSNYLDFKQKLTQANETVIHLVTLQRWSNIKKSLDQQGLEKITNLVSQNILSDKNCGETYEYILYRNLLSHHNKATKALAEFSFTSHENLQQRFAQLDEQVLGSNALRIQQQLAKNQVEIGVSRGRVKNLTQESLISHEVKKKTKHIAIRAMMDRAGNAIQALKPCFLMSPLSVAQYLKPGGLEFDIVIMDEASQIRPEDALGAIARAHKAIIVGDSKQLPPTSFFSSYNQKKEDQEETVLDDTESILDVCAKQFPFKRLKWHYRSEHESLIHFSNTQFYDDDLITIPSPYNQADNYGVHYTYIEEPNYKKGRNSNEAEIVVHHIVQQLKSQPEKSLGVATFNKAQAELINELLDKVRQNDAEFNQILAQSDLSEQLFIKNLENVQGDERDVIFISTTYGPESKGAQVAQRFGPINNDLGWRRLNVIITRAKQKVHVFTSLKPSDVRTKPTSSRGLKAFKKYLEYLYTGTISETGTLTNQEPDSDFEISVINIIQKLGYQCDPQVGVSKYKIDIGIRNPKSEGDYLLGVECDGAAYHSSISARDRDRLRQDNLERKGWTIHRIWSTQWFHSRAVEIERLQKAIEKQIKIYNDKYKLISENESVAIDTSQDLISQSFQQEQADEKIELKEALTRFWQKYIKPDYPNLDKSILNPEIVKQLVLTMPIESDEWFQAIPKELRENIDPKQMQFKEDVLDLIFDYTQ